MTTTLMRAVMGGPLKVLGVNVSVKKYVSSTYASNAELPNFGFQDCWNNSNPFIPGMNDVKSQGRSHPKTT